MRVWSDRKLAAKVIRFLNTLYRLDPSSLEELLDHRVDCNEALARHPTVQCLTRDGRDTVGLLGLLNGLCGTVPRGKFRGWGLVCSIHHDGTGKLTGFGWTDRVVKCSGAVRRGTCRAKR